MWVFHSAQETRWPGTKKRGERRRPKKKKRTSFLQGPFADYTFRRALIWPRAEESPALFADLTGEGEERENPVFVAIAAAALEWEEKEDMRPFLLSLALHVWLRVCVTPHSTK